MNIIIHSQTHAHVYARTHTLAHSLSVSQYIYIYFSLSQFVSFSLSIFSLFICISQFLSVNLSIGPIYLSWSCVLLDRSYIFDPCVRLGERSPISVLSVSVFRLFALFWLSSIIVFKKKIYLCKNRCDTFILIPPKPGFCGLSCLFICLFVLFVCFVCLFFVCFFGGWFFNFEITVKRSFRQLLYSFIIFLNF